MGRKYTDNAVTTLSTSITNVSTTLAVPGTGALFPAVTGAGTPGAATDYFVITLEDASNNIEKIKVETRIVDQMGSGGYPLIRGFDGTTARSWPSGSIVELRWERSGIANLVGKDERDVKSGNLVMNIGRIEADAATAVVAAATTDLGPVAGNYVTVTHASGTLAITSFGGATAAQSGTQIEVQFQVSGGALSITNSASLQCLGANISVENGDMLTAMKVSDAAADWRVMSYRRADGRPARASTQAIALLAAATAADQRAAIGAGVPVSTDSLVPAGAVMSFAMSAAPSGWLKANGAAVNRTTFAALFAAIGTTFGVGDGSTTFNVPDLRGEFVRGWDDGRGVDSGRALGTAQAGANAAHTHPGSSGSTNTAGAHVHGQGATGYAELIGAGSSGTALQGNNTTSAGDHSHTVTLSIASDGGAEARPRNIALLACIKT